MQNCLLEMWKMWSVARQLISCLFSNNKKYCDVLLAIAQQSEARWPESEGQQFDSQKSWSVKPLNGKQTWPTSCPPTTTFYDVLKKDHHLSRHIFRPSSAIMIDLNFFGVLKKDHHTSRHIFRPSFAIMWEKGDCAKLRWWPRTKNFPTLLLCQDDHEDDNGNDIILTVLMVMIMTILENKVSLTLLRALRTLK